LDAIDDLLVSVNEPEVPDVVSLFGVATFIPKINVLDVPAF
jgi:hypothetical protein